MAANQKASWDDFGEIMDVVDLLSLADGRWSRTGIYEALRRNLIPHRKVGRKIILSRNQVRKWLEGEGLAER